MATILCVEDERDLREDITEELEDNGYDVLQAGNGREGFEMTLKHKPDLVLSDITMPIMNGLEFLTKLRNDHPEHAEMPFIFLSALADKQKILDGIKLGADDYLTKPIDYEMLLTKVSSGLRQSKRMIAKKNDEQITLYKHFKQEMSEAQSHSGKAKLPHRNMTLIGRSDKNLWQIQRALEELGQEIQIYTSGLAYLKKVSAQEDKADLTLFCYRSDDLHANAILKSSPNKWGKYFLLADAHTIASNKKDFRSQFLDLIELPIDNEVLVAKLRDWIEDG